MFVFSLLEMVLWEHLGREVRPIPYVHKPQSITRFELALVHTFHLPSGGTDYRSARIPVTFNARRKERTFTVTLRDDVNFEFDEYFFLDLEIPVAVATYGVTKASPDRATVNIEDDGETCYK